MKNLWIISLVIMSSFSFAQVPTTNQLFSVLVITDAEMNAISNPSTGSMVFNNDQQSLYQYTGSEWSQLSHSAEQSIYFGSFLIDESGSKTISGMSFRPSQISFFAYGNIDETDMNTELDRGQSDKYQDNNIVSMYGYARDYNEVITQQVISAGGQGKDNDRISRYASSSHCIGVRFAKKNGDFLGNTTARLTSFNTDGFTIDVDNKLDNMLVLFQAFK